MIVHESEASVSRHDHSVKMFKYRGVEYSNDEWMRNKLNSMFGGSAIACYTPRVTLFKTQIISHMSMFLFFEDRPPTFIQISEWVILDRVSA